jgi:hypothetical protein
LSTWDGVYEEGGGVFALCILLCVVGKSALLQGDTTVGHRDYAAVMIVRGDVVAERDFRGIAGCDAVLAVPAERALVEVGFTVALKTQSAATVVVQVAVGDGGAAAVVDGDAVPGVADKGA